MRNALAHRRVDRECEKGTSRIVRRGGLVPTRCASTILRPSPLWLPVPNGGFSLRFLTWMLVRQRETMPLFADMVSAYGWNALKRGAAPSGVSGF